MGRTLDRLRITSPFLLRTAVPPLSSIQGLKINSLRRLGKRIAFGFENELWLVLHLMIAGRLHWREPAPKLGGKYNLAALDFAHGSLVLTEAGTKKRASLHLVQGEQSLGALDKGGLEVLRCSTVSFKRALTER